MKQKRMKLTTKLLIYIIVFAIGGYFFYKYMPQGFKELVTPATETTAPQTTVPEATTPQTTVPETTTPEATTTETSSETTVPEVSEPASQEVSPAQ